MEIGIEIGATIGFLVKKKGVTDVVRRMKNLVLNGGSPFGNGGEKSNRVEGKEN